MRRAVRHLAMGALGEEIVNRSPRDQPDTRLFAGATIHALSSVEGANVIGRGTTIGARVTVGYTTSVGNHSQIVGPVTIGRYVAIGPHFGAYGENHGIDSVTMFNNHRLLDGTLKVLRTVDPVVIGHGVWTGHGAVVLKGVTVGNGAVLGAGAVVTRDVAPYSIVVGNPARHVRFRFAPEVIERIEALAWWERSLDEMEEIRDLLLVDLNADPDALALLDQAIEQATRTGPGPAPDGR